MFCPLKIKKKFLVVHPRCICTDNMSLHTAGASRSKLYAYNTSMGNSKFNVSDADYSSAQNNGFYL